jgi:hypothetical protein
MHMIIFTCNGFAFESSAGLHADRSASRMLSLFKTSLYFLEKSANYIKKFTQITIGLFLYENLSRRKKTNVFI